MDEILSYVVAKQVNDPEAGLITWYTVSEHTKFIIHLSQNGKP